MAQYQIPYGNTSLQFELPDSLAVDVIAAPDVPAAANPDQLVERALASPLGSRRLLDFPDAHSAAIAINDKTRPVPHEYLLPPLLRLLEQMGLRPRNITLIIATGSHPSLQPEEYPVVVPQAIIDRYPVICHDARRKEDLVALGETSRGTPVWVNRHFLQADLRIVVGNIEPHQFQGFSGGVKSAAIGLAGIETINHNHAMMVHPDARLGIFDRNPARQDVEEIGERIGVHFALNAILNERKQIVQVIAGEPSLVITMGIPLARHICQINVDHWYDVMIVSAGGHPKDINLYQAQKGLAHAALITRPGGSIILAAACPDGTGSRSYEAWMNEATSQGATSPQDLISRFKEQEFWVGPHKAYQIARDMANLNLHLISDMPPDFVRSLLIDPVTDLQATLDTVLNTLPAGCRVGIMPRAASSIPNWID